MWELEGVYALRKDGLVIVVRPTKLQCVIEAIERGLAVYCHGKDSLINGVDIVKVNI